MSPDLDSSRAIKSRKASLRPIFVAKQLQRDNIIALYGEEEESHLRHVFRSTRLTDGKPLNEFFIKNIRHHEFPKKKIILD